MKVRKITREQCAQFENRSYVEVEPQVGDVAIFELGGVPMLIVDLEEYGGRDDLAWCRWQDKHGTPYTKCYPLSELIVIEKECKNCYR